MKQFKIMTGAIFLPDPEEYPRMLYELNQKNHYGQVKEVYGSMRMSYSGLPTARPDFRLPDITWDYLSKYIAACHKFGIIFNYSMNASHLGKLSTISGEYSKIIESLKRLESIGVDRVTVAHPILLDIVCGHTSLPIEISTIMGISSMQAPSSLQAKYPNVDKICLGVDRNRDYAYLNQMKQICDDLGIECEVMVSEFCMTTSLSSCTNTLRKACYDIHAMNMSQEEAQKGINPDGTKQQKELKGFPWTGKNGCVFGRSNDELMWAVSRTIWPNDIPKFLEITDITSVKVTTRTAHAHFGIELTERYASCKYDGPLAGLWLQLQVSTNDKREDIDKFNKEQEKLSNITSYTCKQLSTPQQHHIHIPGNGQLDFEGVFMSIFEEFPEINWNDVVWVDKDSSDCKPWECNWAHKFIKQISNAQK